ncbi:hypothetical protein M899_0934 [Bacteriovorax sp. BSW11_IV]|uniref:hypothetical protein n=1 Tax=Bacteriovorax sp. BSW11_IV TaxID=1353529 RepID=UPI00038A0E30|nr:hypothetical protein [Bacteriovorax sp. BSW11_IV]EQC48728.1 hypothetical protein M899_0934 [Bacteriovorax sp. BSW11_IV]
MKTIISFLILTTLSISSYATCDQLFSQGSIEYSFAGRTFEDGSTAYDEAVAESKKPDANMGIICEKLFLSASGFQYAVKGFQNCANIFRSAMDVCSGTDKITASKHKNTCLSNKDVSTENFSYIYNEYKRNCYQE